MACLESIVNAHTLCWSWFRQGWKTIKDGGKFKIPWDPIPSSRWHTVEPMIIYAVWETAYHVKGLSQVSWRDWFSQVVCQFVTYIYRFTEWCLFKGEIITKFPGATQLCMIQDQNLFTIFRLITIHINLTKNIITSIFLIL